MKSDKGSAWQDMKRASQTTILIAFLAGLIFAFYPEHIAFSHYLYAEILLEFLIIFSTYLAFSGNKYRLMG